MHVECTYGLTRAIAVRARVSCVKRAGRVLKGMAGPKKMATGINYCQNGRLAKAKVTLVVWTQALSHN